MNHPFPLYVQAYVDIQTASLNRPFTYGVPETLRDSVYLGAAVKVPFNRREIVGYVVDVTEFPPSLPRDVEIKPVIEVLESRSLWDNEMLELARWLENYYCSSFVSALKVLIPGPVRLTKDGKLPRPARIKKIAAIQDPSTFFETLDTSAPAQAKVARYLYRNPGVHAVSDVVEVTGVTHSALKALEKKGIVELFDDAAPVNVFSAYTADASGALPLTDDQKKVFENLMDLYRRPSAEVALLHGVTGSGKTEIYLQVIEQVLRDGREALVLVPEISLTPQSIERFRGRFDEEIAILHSRLTENERRHMWWKIRNKGARVVLGARSAIFAPLENIGVIVVDEEHETSYKQEKDPRYNARQVAVKRAMTHKSLVILGSATPSLEVYHWAQEGKYHYLGLPRRIGQSVLPEINLVDLKKDLPRKKDEYSPDKPPKPGAAGADRNCIIGNTLRLELSRILDNDEQAILFLNRRGFAAFLLCQDCSNVIRCPYCDITLTFHKNDRMMKCHYCDYQRPAPNLCPFCSGTRLAPLSWGIQKAEEEIRTLFPDAPLIRMDRDTTAGRDAHYRLLKQFSARKASILLGTQMVAKGLDFPGVTLVGVILADVSLYLPDFRSLERTYQILVQVAGRAGRRDTPGSVVIQTFNPESPVYQAVIKQDFDEFFNWEREHRRTLLYPPFSHVINMLFSGENSEKVREHSMRLGELLRGKGLSSVFHSVLGPAPCPIARIRSRYRWHLMLKGDHVPRMVAVIKAAEKKIPLHAGITCSVDVDPMNLV